ncbi:hypothetical protein [Parasitella parasitica]|uniref:Uncharacterized protein n=1 Tax=Parasitella parasitica TaxID=35722 RepID=A0A0B7NJE6_9FUNG|nr:hypothetical protein [Parasitella parasitica]
MSAGQSSCQFLLVAACVKQTVKGKNVGASVALRTAFIVCARVGNVFGETVTASVVSVEDDDVVISCVDSVEINLEDHDNLNGRIEATPTDKMSSVIFR